jgi:CBS domain-containing protein
MTEKLTRRGLRVHSDFEVDPLRTTTVSEVMTRDVRTLPPDETITRARRVMGDHGHGAYPLVDEDGSLAGIVARGDLLRAPELDGGPVADVASPDVVTVAPDEPVLAALQLMLEEEVEHLPVVDDGRLVGICTRTDILRARRRQLELERAERGWRPGRAG